MRVLVTRPSPQSAEWVDGLRAHAIDAVALPLLAIGAAPDPAAVVAAWGRVADQRLVVFVSPNAAQAFFDQAPAGLDWPPGLRAASPGPGTSAVLVRLGVPAAAVVEPEAASAQFDSEALWQRLEADDWRDAGVLIVRGTAGRDWLADRFVERGARIERVAAYTRSAPALDNAQIELLGAAIAAPRRHLWLFSSSEAIDHLASMRPALDRDVEPWRDASAIATHPRIAARAQQLGFGRVVGCRPGISAVVACIQSMGP
jgi:uroporphyrinogen-III synthase